MESIIRSNEFALLCGVHPTTLKHLVDSQKIVPAFVDGKGYAYWHPSQKNLILLEKLKGVAGAGTIYFKDSNLDRHALEMYYKDYTKHAFVVSYSFKTFVDDLVASVARKTDASKIKRDILHSLIDLLISRYQKYFDKLSEELFSVEELDNILPEFIEDFFSDAPTSDLYVDGKTYEDYCQLYADQLLEMDRRLGLYFDKLIIDLGISGLSYKEFKKNLGVLINNKASFLAKINYSKTSSNASTIQRIENVVWQKNFSNNLRDGWSQIKEQGFVLVLDRQDFKDYNKFKSNLAAFSGQYFKNIVLELKDESIYNRMPGWYRAVIDLAEASGCNITQLYEYTSYDVNATKIKEAKLSGVSTAEPENDESIFDLFS